MINYVYGEQLYQEFVSFRDLFLKKAVARAQHVDTASDGRPVRPVVVLPFKETDSIQAEIDKSINLDQIKDYAEKKLHMIYPKDSDVLLYQRDSDDYFRQYESVD